MDPTTSSDPDTLPASLIGDANEVPAVVEGLKCMALVDTGSQVTTISDSFYQCHLSHAPLQSCQGLVRLESATGEGIPYTGYLIVSLHLNGTKPIEVPVLVVHNTSYNHSVPLLIGTNVLSRLEVSSSDGKLHANVHMAIKTTQLVTRHLEKSGGTYDTMYAADDCDIRPGELIPICAIVCITVPVAQSVAMVSELD